MIVAALRGSVDVTINDGSDEDDENPPPDVLCKEAPCRRLGQSADDLRTKLFEQQSASVCKPCRGENSSQRSEETVPDALLR